ncbi:MAG: pyridoxal phosphate-dependent aminotransferase [Alphaproteobacteria bacterium]
MTETARYDRPSSTPAGPATRAQVAPFLAMDVMSEANRLDAQGRDVLHLEIGQPAAPAPEPVRRAAARVLETGRVAYTEALGIPALRARIARAYGEQYGIEVDPDRVAVTAGSSSAFQFLFLALFEPGARVGLTRPSYPAYPNIMKALGLRPVFIETDPARGHALDPAMLERAIAGGLDGVLLASPANPTGTVLPAEDLARCADLARDAGIPFIVDEIYHGLEHDRSQTGRRTPCALATGTDAIVVNSFSKYYCMAGWRIGWTVVPPGLTRTIECLAQNLMVAPPTLGQHAALAAFEPESIAAYDAVVRDYTRARDRLVDALPRLGFTDLSRADGAFYVYGGIGRFGMESTTFCSRLLQDTGLAITPGLDFDDVRGAGTVRFSFAGGAAQADEAIRRLEQWCPRQLDPSNTGAVEE